MQPRTKNLNFTEPRLKYRIQQKELLALQLHEQSNHGLRHSQRAGLLFEQGEGGYEQFLREFYTRATKMNGLAHLGFHEIFPEYDENFPLRGEVTAQVQALLSKVNVTGDDVENIIAAHSQGPFATIPLIIGLSMLAADREDKMLQFKQPNSQNIIFYRDGDAPLYARIQYDYFPIANFNGVEVGILPGPLEMTYQVIQKESKPGSQGKKVWGYELQYIETSSEDIVSALRDARFPPGRVRQCYCSEQQVKDFKLLVATHMESLIQRDLRNNVIYPPLNESPVELHPGLQRQQQVGFQFFSTVKDKVKRKTDAVALRFGIK